MKKMQTLNMCDFCCLEVESCGARTVLAGEIRIELPDVERKPSVVACDSYKSPVETLRKKFH